MNRRRPLREHRGHVRSYDFEGAGAGQLLAAHRRHGGRRFCGIGLAGLAPLDSPSSERPHQISRYQAWLSGPFLNRIYRQIEVPVIPPAAVAAIPDGQTSALVAGRVGIARKRALARQGCSNALLKRNRSMNTHGLTYGPVAESRRASGLVRPELSPRAARPAQHCRSRRQPRNQRHAYG